MSLRCLFVLVMRPRRAAAIVAADPMVERVTRKLQEADDAPADTVSVSTAAMPAMPTFNSVRTGVQNLFGKVGDWFAEVGQLRPTLPSLPQREPRYASC